MVGIVFILLIMIMLDLFLNLVKVIIKETLLVEC